MEEGKEESLKRKRFSPFSFAKNPPKKLKKPIIPITKSLSKITKQSNPFQHCLMPEPCLNFSIDNCPSLQPALLPTPIEQPGLLPTPIELPLNTSLGGYPWISKPIQGGLKESLLCKLLRTSNNLETTPTKVITEEGLDLKYMALFSQDDAGRIFRMLEEQTEYLSGNYAKIKYFGFWHNIPRKQVAYGDEGLTYSFSGNTIPALPWTDLMAELRDVVNYLAQEVFNFVLVNRYNDGNDHIGEHQDNEKDLDASAPIASLSFGQARDFVLRHKDARKNHKTCKFSPIIVQLASGSLLLMNPPTNTFWYHSLPKRKGAKLPRINLTFRKILHNNG